MTTERTLDELPDAVYVALGRRGMEAITLKDCAYDCEKTELELVRVETTPKRIKNEGVEKVTEDWIVRCKGCRRKFTIRCEIRFADGQRMDTKVNIIDENGTDLGWLGSY